MNVGSLMFMMLSLELNDKRTNESEFFIISFKKFTVNSNVHTVQISTM